MKILKSFELLNSEGPILKIEKRENHWAYSFHDTDIRVISNTEEILSFILGYSTICHPVTRNTMSWDQYPDSMKVKSHIRNAVICILTEEIDSIKNNSSHMISKIFLKLF